MSRTTATIPDDLTVLIQGAVKAGLFGNKSDAIRQVRRGYFEEQKNDRIAAAVTLYRDENITLVTAAQLPDLNHFEMRDILREEDVELRVIPEDMADTSEEIDVAHDQE